MNSVKTEKPRVLIVGGGFAGLNAAKHLGKDANVQVTLVDRNNYHLFQPLLYQVAMAGLSPAEIAIPIRSVLARYHIQVLMGNVRRVDLAQKAVETDFGPLPYDYLILACGAQHSYFGYNEWENYAPGLKTLEQATEIRRRVLTAFEEAERASDPERRKQLLTFVVVGGGPTGVELAGALGEISRFTLSRDFSNIDPRLARIILLEAGTRILPAFSQDLTQKAVRDLENLGVQVWTSSRVTKITDAGVQIGDEWIKARTVLWAAGVKPAALNENLGVALAPDGRVIVEADLSLKAFPNVFILGDQAFFRDERGRVLPGLAPVAIQEGAFVADIILREVQGKARKKFVYIDKGQLATIGRKKAIMQTLYFSCSGFLAWFLWLTIHIFYLIGFRNRLLVLINWAWSYFRYRRGARLIVGKEWRSFSS